MILLDGREDGELLTLDPATSSITVTEIVRGAGVDFTRADLLAGDPNGVWLEVSRMTITKDDEHRPQFVRPEVHRTFRRRELSIDMSLAAEELFF